MKKKILGLLMGATLAVGLAACGNDKADDGNKTASAGDAEKIVNQKCISCHGENLKGGVGPALDKIGSQLSKDEIHDIIINGKGGGMPPKLIEGKDADAVAAWLSEKK